MPIFTEVSLSTFAVTGLGFVNFIADAQGWSETATSAVSVRGFPGGDRVAISLAGQREVTRTVTCAFSDRGVYVSFALMRNKVGFLTITNWDSVEAVLKESNPDPPLRDGTIMAKATFVLL